MTHFTPTSSATSSTSRLGMWLAVATVALTLVTFGLAITAIPDAGPHCRADCAEYPFTSQTIADQWPGDYLWMFPAMVLMLVFVALVAVIHELGLPGTRVYSLVALVIAALASGVLIVDYFVQVTVMQPSLEKGQLDGWSMLTQYNPNGVFIALEELGYLLTSIALACLIPALGTTTRLEQAVRWVFGLGLISTLIAFAIVTAGHGIDRQDIYEVPAISIAWMSFVIGGWMLAVIFRRQSRVQDAEAGEEAPRPIVPG